MLLTEMYNMGHLITFAAFANRSIVLCNSKTRTAQQSRLHNALYHVTLYILICIVNLHTIKQQQSVAERKRTQQCSFQCDPYPAPQGPQIQEQQTTH